MTHHRIRLRDPWRCELADPAALWRRKFGRPAGLDPETEVWLVVENARGPLSVRLNGELLGRVCGQGGSGRFQVADRLLARNEVAIVAESLSATAEAIEPRPPADVCLEIVADA